MGKTDIGRLGMCLLALVSSAGIAQVTPDKVTPDTPDIPARFEFPAAMFDYTVREAMVPMRDGVRLRTVIVLPRQARHAPMVLTRTPYNAGRFTDGSRPRSMRELLPGGDDIFADGGYIRVYQDVRGKYGSEGDYFMVPPLVGTINASKVDDSTDAWDTIEWLLHNVPESNGRVGIIGFSYDGFTAAMALIRPHPALKVAAPENPMIDSWMGDDWFHHGAFRNVNLGYFTSQTSRRGSGSSIPKPGIDDYATYLRGGSAGEYAKNAGLEQLPFWQKILAHPTYDAFWREQAVDRILAKQPLKVPTLWVQGLWDHVDMWGASHSYAAVEPKDRRNDMNYLVMGPWAHGQQNRNGSSLGALRWNGDTAAQYRHEMLKPFFDSYLVDGAPKHALSPVTAYNAGENRWNRYERWPLACEEGCAIASRPMYLRAGEKLAFTPPQAGEAESGGFVSDPARPVPVWPRPNGVADPEGWRSAWAAADQRFVDGRPDVISYLSEPLTEPLQVSGAPVVKLYASTSGSDSDWVVKIIDVHPDSMPAEPAMGGYQLPVSMDIFRGRYRTSFEHPSRIEPDAPLLYTFTLPNINHRFQPGHRIMVQIQSSWFPLYDRNPQTYVDSIFFAKPDDYKLTWQKVWHTPTLPSSISMPVTSGQ